MLEVELDAFSGLPNPRWELSAAQTAEFLARIRSLPPTPGTHIAGEGLGYRGFVVRAKGDLVDRFDEVRLYRGSVVLRRGDRAETFNDPDHNLERELLASARGHVSNSVLLHIQTEIAH